MSRKKSRVQYHLDPAKTEDLPDEDLRAILRGADDLIMRGGRTLLVKLLRRSRAKEVTERGLDKSPVYGLSWRPTAAATPTWAEALDGGNPNTGVPFGDPMMRRGNFLFGPESRITTGVVHRVSRHGHR